MMRKLLTLLFLVVLLVFASNVSAQNTTTGSVQTSASSASKLKEQIELLQKQRNTDVSQIKDEAKAMIQAKRDEFKTRLQTIKDQKKKALVERIDTKLALVNKSHTAKFSEALIRLQGFLDKISKSTTNAQVLADIAAAQAAIDVAKAAVNAQTATTYTMEIVDDKTLKLNAGTTVSQLRKDLIGVYKLVVDAKQAVQKVNTDRSLIKKEATKSAEL